MGERNSRSTGQDRAASECANMGRQMSNDIKPAREWIIKGGLYVYDRPGGPPGNQCINHVDGELLGFNESVRVREVLPDTITISREEFHAAVAKNGVGGLLNCAEGLENELFGSLASNDKGLKRAKEIREGK